MSPFRSTPAALFAASLLFAVHGLPAQEPLPSITEETQGMQRRDGFLPLFWDADAGKLLLEIPRLGEEMIYVVSLPTGLGSNDVGLDRTQLGGERIVRWERVGPKVLLVQPNYGFRAETANPDERRAVEESFATSTLWGFTAVAEEGGRTLVDATDFALADARDVVGTLKRAGQGSWKLEESRSAV
ncbi:MAG: DUF5117 domain-containing protein, partial [Longimicrobiaceae bacterium]